jgi:hypothetical protein
MQQPRICRSDLLYQRLCHCRILSHELTHVCQLTRGKLGHPPSSTTTTKSARILPLLLLLLGKLEEVGGSGLLDWLLGGGWVSGRLLRLELWGGLLSSCCWAQLSLDIIRDPLTEYNK